MTPSTVMEWLGDDGFGVIVDALVAYLPVIQERKSANPERLAEALLAELRKAEPELYVFNGAVGTDEETPRKAEP